MRLLDLERQDAKRDITQLSDELSRMTRKAQSNREGVVALETTVKDLTRHNEKLESELASQVERRSELQAALEEEKARVASLERALNAYKAEHKLGRDLAELQESVVALQVQLRNQDTRENEK